MITGYNTDVEHGGVIYHVQTEDKGLESPLILSLVYAGGAILASKRSRYEDLIAAGFSDEVLAERLKRQHRLICAAIHAGRLDDLKRMGDPEAEGGSEETASEAEVQTAAQLITAGIDQTEETASETEMPAAADPISAGIDQTQEDSSPRAVPDPVAASVAAYTVHDPRRRSPADLEKTEDGVWLRLLDEQEFRSGDSLTLRIMLSQVSGDSEKPLSGITVSVKILGTMFRPQIYSMKTQRDGVAIISAQVPEFTSGRAAILVRAVANGTPTELRRVILPA